MPICCSSAVQNHDLTVAALGFVLLAAYYAALYWTARRRSAPHIVPLHEPPQGMSAASVQCLVDKRRSDRTMTLAVMELIAIRAMRLDKSTLNHTLRLEKPSRSSLEGLKRDELLPAILGKLFLDKESLCRYGDKECATRFRDARRTLIDHSSVRLDKLVDPRRALAHGGLLLWLLWLLACISASWAADPKSGGSAAVIALSLALVAAIASFYLIRWRTRSADREAERKLRGWGAMILAPFTVFGWPLLFLLPQLKMPPHLWPIVLPALSLPLVMWAYRFAARYTAEGEQAMDRIAGFKAYLAATQCEPPDAQGSGENQLQVYERHLPYAVALGEAGKWAAVLGGLTATVAGMAAVRKMREYYGDDDSYDPDDADDFDTGIAAFIMDSVFSSSGTTGSSWSWLRDSSDSSSSNSSSNGSWFSDSSDNRSWSGDSSDSGSWSGDSSDSGLSGSDSSDSGSSSDSDSGGSSD